MTFLPPDFGVLKLEATDSTNSHARREIGAGRLSGRGLVMAGIQTRGRGRGENLWHSDRPLGFWATLYHPDSASDLFLPVARAAVSAAEVLRAHGAAASLKWPNDLLVGRKKIGGILSEKTEDHVLIGLGINLLQSAGDFPVGLSLAATSLFMETGRTLSPDSFLEAFLTDYLCRNDPERIFEAYTRNLSIRNERMEIAGHVFTVTGVRKDGVLCGLADDGRPLEFHTGTLRWAHDA